MFTSTGPMLIQQPVIYGKSSVQRKDTKSLVFCQYQYFRQPGRGPSHRQRTLFSHLSQAKLLTSNKLYIHINYPK